MRKGGNVVLSVLCSVFAVFLMCGVLSAADREDEPLLGVKEGWAWPVVVIQPKAGWESPEGEAVKFALRIAEREVSVMRNAIRGKEVTFMFSSVKTPKEIRERMATWRAMKVCVILSFDGGENDAALMEICKSSGPSLVLAAGESYAIRDTAGKPFPYLFALEYPYFARANALASVAALERPLKKTAVMTDNMSARLAKGARLNETFLKARGIETRLLSISGLRQDQFNPQVNDLESSGARIITSWLDAMVTLSIWRTASMSRNGTTVYYAGNRQQLLLDAEGLLLVDKDVLLERNETGKHDIMIKIRDRFDKEVKNPVLAAKAYALGRWVIGAYADAKTADAGEVAKSLASVKGIPLMDEILSIDPRTNRPVSRRFGILKIAGRQYESAGSVEVFSIEVSE